MCSQLKKKKQLQFLFLLQQNKTCNNKNKMQTIFKLQKLKKNSTLEIRKIKLNLQIKQCK